MKKIISLPQKTKFKKQQKGHLTSVERKKSATALYYGIFGLKVLQQSRLTRKQLEATRKQISRNLRKQEKLWIRTLPDIPVTNKPKEIRMGKGKGAVESWIIRVKAGQTLFELSTMGLKKAKIILLAAAKKLAVPCAFISQIKKI